MNTENLPDFLIITGPSGIGKTPLKQAAYQFYPKLLQQYRPLVLYTSRSPRPGEVEGRDYFFMSRAEIQRMAHNPGFIVLKARADLQALDLHDLQTGLDNQQKYLYEGNPYMAVFLLELAHKKGIKTRTVFISPISRAEINAIKNQLSPIEIAAQITAQMQTRLEQRTLHQSGTISPEQAEDIRIRASKAYTELKQAWKFGNIIPTHDGEDSPNWTPTPRPGSDAAKTVAALAALICGETNAHLEHWEKDLIP